MSAVPSEVINAQKHICVTGFSFSSHSRALRLQIADLPVQECADLKEILIFSRPHNKTRDARFCYGISPELYERLQKEYLDVDVENTLQIIIEQFDPSQTVRMAQIHLSAELRVVYFQISEGGIFATTTDHLEPGKKLRRIRKFSPVH